MGMKETLTQTTQRAVQRCLDGYRQTDCLLVLDGNTPVGELSPLLRSGLFMPKADALVGSVAAASILAKEYRDHWMKNVACTLYPGYCFEDHVGYGTVDHREALYSLGVCPLHRKSYLPIKEMLDGNKERAPGRAVGSYQGVGR